MRPSATFGPCVTDSSTKTTNNVVAICVLTPCSPGRLDTSAPNNSSLLYCPIAGLSEASFCSVRLKCFRARAFRSARMDSISSPTAGIFQMARPGGTHARP